MKYLKQIALIVLFSFLGEICRAVIPLPVPASIYGMVLMFAALSLKIVKLEQVGEAGRFLTSVLPVLFVAPAVGIVEHWALIRPQLLAIVLLILGTTAATFGISGRITQWLSGKEEKQDD